MNELGARLKEARLSKGYSLDDLQELTKIQKRYLVGIEEGNYSIMPGSFYVRAFIKQYAEAVGLDPDEILETFKKELPGSPSGPVSNSMVQGNRRKLTKGPSNKMLEAMPKFIVGIFIVVIIIVFWVLSQQGKDNGEPSTGKSDGSEEVQYAKKPVDSEEEEKRAEKKKEEQAKRDKEKEEAKAQDEPIDEEVKQTISAGTIEADGATTNYTLDGADTFKIRIEVSGPTWVGIRDQQQVELLDSASTRSYNAGEIVEFDATAQNYVRIRLGDSQNAKVYINDELVTYAQQIVTQNIVINFNKEQ
ncbi:MAG: helix-turn-helix domain-containing protein [Lysinibacillus sp.]